MAADAKTQMLVLTAMRLREICPDDETFREAMKHVEAAAAEVVKEGRAKGGARGPSVKPSPFRKG